MDGVFELFNPVRGLLLFVEQHGHGAIGSAEVLRGRERGRECVGVMGDGLLWRRDFFVLALELLLLAIGTRPRLVAFLLPLPAVVACLGRGSAHQTRRKKKKILGRIRTC